MPDCPYCAPDEPCALRVAGQWLAGRTAAGRTVRIPEFPGYRGAVVEIDGERVEVFRFQRLRDGGTTIVETSAGRIVWPHRIGSDDRTPKLDGEPIR